MTELQKGVQLALAMAMESLFEFPTDLSKEVLKVKQLDKMFVQAKVLATELQKDA